MNRFRFFFVLACALLLCSPALYAQSDSPAAKPAYERGIELFSRNKPQDAIVFLQQAVLETNVNPHAYNYLGLCYYQTGQFQKSLDTFILGTQVPETDKRILYYNAGNTCFAMGMFERAEEMFTYALAADPLFGSATLNRANSRMKLTHYSDAVIDYERYLALVPDSDQAEQIRILLALLAKEAEAERIAEENRRLEAERVAEQNARIEAQKAADKVAREAREAADREAEAERIAALEKQLEEQRAREAERKAQEEERRRKLLEEIALSLQENESTNISAGTEGVLEYEHEEELD